MPFKKGDKNINRKGRPKGSKNLTTVEVKNLLLEIVSKEFSIEQVSRDLKKLDPDQRLNFFLRLTRSILPKEQEFKVDYEKLTSEQMDAIINEITNSNETKQD